MRRIFTLSLALVCLTVIKSFGQTCGPIAEDFNTTVNGMAGFTSSNFVYATTGTGQNLNGFLQVTPVTASNWYSLSSRTFYTAAGATSLDFGFVIGGSEKISNITVYIDYYVGGNKTSQQVLNTAVSAANYTGAGSNAIYTVCQSVPFSQIPGYTAGSLFQVRVVVQSATGNGTNNTTITFDNFRTSSTTSQIILPVHFSNIAVRKSSEGASVNWSVGTEQNVSGYDVEKSVDGRSFTKIGFVAASGQSAYSFTDAKAGVVNFYRVKSVDVDGKFGYSTVVSFNNGASSVVVKAFMSDKNTLTVQHDAAQGGSRISVISMDGRIVKVQLPAAGAQQTKVDMSNAQTGLYIIRYDNGQGGSESIKVAK